MRTVIRHLRCLALAVIACIAIAACALSASVTIATLTPAHAQVSAEFQSALEPYGSWQPHPRFGEVWVPYDLPPGWRPYTYGRWVYTEEWGWYWVSDEEEADWGWVAFHYGRWAHDRRLGWFWVPGDEWGPAWVDWRRGDDYVGWAPLPPDEVVYEYDNDPAYWIFLPPRYLVAPRVRTYFLPPQRIDCRFSGARYRQSHGTTRTSRSSRTLRRQSGYCSWNCRRCFASAGTDLPCATPRPGEHARGCRCRAGAATGLEPHRTAASAWPTASGRAKPAAGDGAAGTGRRAACRPRAAAAGPPQR